MKLLKSHNLDHRLIELTQVDFSIFFIFLLIFSISLSIFNLRPGQEFSKLTRASFFFYFIKIILFFFSSSFHLDSLVIKFQNLPCTFIFFMRLSYSHLIFFIIK